MKESSTKAVAVVTMTVEVQLTQPWGGEFTLDQVQKAARHEAEDRMSSCAQELAKRDIRVGKITKVRIMLNEETVS